MEFLTILLSGLIGLTSSAGFVIDQAAANLIRSQFQTIEQLQVRVDNTPSYQILQGKVDRLQIAAQGLFPFPEMRIARLELETDPIDLDPSSLGQRPLVLNRPFQASARVVLNQADINRALKSAAIANQFRNLLLTLPNSPISQVQKRYDLLNPQVTFLDNQRLRLQVDLKEQGDSEILPIVVEASINVIGGQRLQFTNLVGTIAGETAPPELLGAIADNFSDRFDVRTLETKGITARVLQLNIVPDQSLELAVFVRVDPHSLAALGL